MQASATAAREAIPAAVVARPASSSDLPAIMAIERLPGFELHVGRSEEAEHRAMMASPAYAYRLGIRAGVEAFAILSGVGDPHGNLYLKRIAVSRPDEGLGSAFLGLVLGEAFGPLGADRVSLDCFARNARAQRVYQKLGFTRDGLLRKAYRLPDGTRTDLVLMALLKSEWEGGRG
ncbi:MAG: GNAT family N-acetyltransferase [Hyphomicrobiales bacterium]|nr:GNAT family N-acetyltransferase [Hyphomicrobiales bacterium]MBV8441847.1 GNAT family N-acetyltransferase [Hyphomicrobiales bacterium]